MMHMNALHAANAWELRRRDPIAPHGLAFLFVQPDRRPGRGGRYRLTAATKLWLAGDTKLDLPERLFRYHHGVSSILSAKGADVRTLANKRDAEMADDAIYVGLGASSLDTSTGDWAQVVATAATERLAVRAGDVTGRAPITGEHDVPGCIRIVLTDDTAIVAERRGMPEFNHRVIHATGTLNYTPFESPYAWGRCTRDQLDADPAHVQTLRWMAALNDLFWQTNEVRLVSGRTL
jgi:hypothetical protein